MKRLSDGGHARKHVARWRAHTGLGAFFTDGSRMSALGAKRMMGAWPRYDSALAPVALGENRREDA